MLIKPKSFGNEVNYCFLCKVNPVRFEAVTEKLVVHVDTEALELSEKDTIAILEDETYDGTPIIGEDTVRVVP